MNEEELKQKVAHLRGYAKALVTAMWLMNERRHILHPLLNDEPIRKALGEKLANTYGARAHQHLVPLLAQDFLRDLARLFLDDDRRAASLVNVFRKVSEPEVKQSLREYFRTVPDKWDDANFTADGFTEAEVAALREEWKKREREDYVKSFDNGIASVEKAIKELAADPITEKIKTFRDKNHAHLEMLPLGKDPSPFPVSELGLKFNDLFAFADRYSPAILEVTRVVTGELFAIKSFEEAHRTSGLDYWQILAGLKNGNG